MDNQTVKKQQQKRLISVANKKKTTRISKVDLDEE